MPPTKRVHFVLPEALIDQLDKAKAEGQSRGEYVRQAIREKLASVNVETEETE